MNDAVFPQARDTLGPIASESEGPEPEAHSARERISKASSALRMTGSVLLVVAASTFMLQHWQHGSSWLRYLCLFGHTALLAAAGFACGLRVRENRAARTFFGLVLTSIPVHFAVLGAVLRSAFPLDTTPGFNALWPISGPFAALGLVALGGTMALLLTRLAVRALCRPHEWALSRAILALNAFALIPLRAPDTVALLAVLMTGTWLLLDAKLSGLGFALHTPGARFVRAMIPLPLLVITGRTLLWYTPSAFACGGFALAAGLWVFVALPRMLAGRPLASLVQTTGMGCAVLGAVLMASELTELASFPRSLELPFTLLPAAVLALVLSFFMTRGGVALRRCAALVTSAALCIDVVWLSSGSVSSGGIALSAGVALIVFGIQVGQRSVFAAGAFATCVGVGHVISTVVELGDLRSWPTLTALGVALIFCAALIERHADRLLRCAFALRDRLCAW